MANEIKFDKVVDIGATSLGKYTFPIIELFEMNVLAVLLTVDEK